MFLNVLLCENLAIILMRKRELIALLNLSAWCLVMVERLFLAGRSYSLTILETIEAKFIILT